MVLAPLDLLPAWYPGGPLSLGLVVLIIAVLTMNRGRWWFVNVLATDEPVIVAIGATIILLAWSGWLDTVLNSMITSMTGFAIPSEVWWVLGAGIAALGLGVYLSEDLDISGFIG